MERFLSPAWFAMVNETNGGAVVDPAEADIVLQQVVTGTPDGPIRYQVSVGAGRATILEGSPGHADMTFTSDYRTAASIATGRLSTETALIEGRIRVSGNLARLAGRAEALSGADPLAGVRDHTEFPESTEFPDGGDA